MTEKATFAAGCFWGVEEAFGRARGIISTRVGYTGGSTNNPTYGDVCTGRTGHAESVEVLFNPSEISYEQLLDLFWSIHDPTTRNRQGPDIGSQYRSVIFYNSQEQKAAAVRSRAALEASGRLGAREIVTEILPAGRFFEAEEYHQRYFEKTGRGSCHSA